MTTYHTTLTLGPRHFKKYKITDSYSLHRVVYGLFEKPEESGEDSTKSRILYCDMGGDFAERHVQILSGREPRGHDFDEAALSTKQITDRFFGYDTYSFRVAINPVRRKGSVEIPITNKVEVLAWFAEKAPVWGFKVDVSSIEIDTVGALQFQDKGGREVTLCQAKIRGSLKVVDREKFIGSAKNGIGRGKSFGCGLLLLQPQIHNKQI